MQKNNKIISILAPLYFILALIMVPSSVHAQQPPSALQYTEGGYSFALPSGVPYFARGVGTFPSGNGSVLNNASTSVIAYCPSCGVLGVLTITNNSNATFKLTSFNLGGFSPPNGYVVNVNGYDASNNLVYQSGNISVTGIYNLNTPGSSTLQSVTLGMTTAVSKITITPTSGGGDCVCTEKFTLVSGSTTTTVLDGVTATTTTVAPNNNNNNNNNNQSLTPVTGTLTPPVSIGQLPTTNATFNASTIGTTTDRKFDGGKIIVDTSNFTDTHAYTVTSNGGIIDIVGHLTDLSGTLSNDSGSSGKLYVINSSSGGKLILDNTSNSFSGGYSVQAGATLEIPSAAALGTSSLDLVGSSTIPAILSVTGTTTLNQTITVAGDPTFNIASGTTTTVSTAIADGGLPGDVVVSGGGTLALSAANTYTGSTTISNDNSTLLLLNNGTITSTSGLTNNGNFDLRSVTSAATSSVTVNSYTQTSSGKLYLSGSSTSLEVLNVVGTASLAGSVIITTNAAAPLGRYVILTANSVSGTFSSVSANYASYNSLLHASLAYDATNVYLVLTNGPASDDTQAALQSTAHRLKSVFNLQSAVLTSDLSADCPVFDKNNACMSLSGRYTALNSSQTSSDTGIVTLGYKIDEHMRVGAFIDQSISNRIYQSIGLSAVDPAFGAFAVWAENSHAQGFELRVAAGYGSKDLTITRDVVNSSEAGQGSAHLGTGTVQALISYDMQPNADFIIAPYAGLRYLRQNLGSYTEATNASVTTPLTMSSLTQSSTSLLAGAELKGKFNNKIAIFAKAGLEQDLNIDGGTYNASGVSGLTDFTFNSSPTRTRPTASLGAYYDLSHAERVSIEAGINKSAFQSQSTSSVLMSYAVGF